VVRVGAAVEAVRALLKHDVVTTPRGGGVRFATHVFNDESDVERALAAVDQVALRPLETAFVVGRDGSCGASNECSSLNAPPRSAGVHRCMRKPDRRLGRGRPAALRRRGSASTGGGTAAMGGGTAATGAAAQRWAAAPQRWAAAPRRWAAAPRRWAAAPAAMGGGTAAMAGAPRS